MLYWPERLAIWSNLTVLARKILSTVREPVVLTGREHWVTASIGISIFPQDGADKQSLMKAADIAICSAKKMAVIISVLL